MAQNKLLKADTKNNTGTGDVFVFQAAPTLTGAVLMTGTLGIGSSTGFTGTANTLLSLGGSQNTYIQTYLQNASVGTNASSDYILGADNDGVALTGHFHDMGITNSGYAFVGFDAFAVNDGYDYVSGGNLVIGTDGGVAGKVMKVIVGGTTANDVRAVFSRTELTVGLAGNTTGVIAFAGSGSSSIKLQGQAFGSSSVLTLPAVTDTLVGKTTTDTLTNKRVTKRVVTAADATSITPNSDNADWTYQANTQATGTLTINADGGTPTNTQPWGLKIKSTNVQTFSWNALFVGGTTALPTTSTGGGKIDYFTFIYDTVNSKWHYTGTALNF